MAIIKVYGGLGNQMFQYAFGKALEKRGVEVRFDLTWFDKPQQNVLRPYGLDKMRTRVLTTSMLHKNTVHETEKTYYRYVEQYLDPEFAKNNNFFGYWQNRGYVIPVLEELKHDFRIKLDYMTDEYVSARLDILGCDNSIGLHIRRGDYLTKGHHLLPIEYYDSALYHLREKKLDGKVFIFSDDLPWCKNHFKGPRYFFIEVEDYLCLDLLRCCKHKITANSTFSWWAGILGEASDSKTFAPLRWRLDDKEEGAVAEEKFIPENWIRI